MRGDQIETFQIMEFLMRVQIFFNISPRKTKSTNQLDFFVNSTIYFYNKLPNQIKKCNSVKILILNWTVSEKIVKE